MQQGYSGGIPHNVSPHNGMDYLLDQQDRATGTVQEKHGIGDGRGVGYAIGCWLQRANTRYPGK